MITAFFFPRQTLFAYPPSAMPAFVALFPLLFYDAFFLLWNDQPEIKGVGPLRAPGAAPLAVNLSSYKLGNVQCDFFPQIILDSTEKSPISTYTVRYAVLGAFNQHNM
jgi:hypothetical protein